MTSDDFMRLMVRDKKVLDGQLRLVLLNGIGQAVVRADFEVSLLEQVLSDACNA
jgi:3-dehydroquinate synthase